MCIRDRPSSPASGGGGAIIEPIPEEPLVDEPDLEPIPEQPTAEEPDLEPDLEPIPEEPPTDMGGTVQLSWDYPQYRMDGSDLELYEIQSFRIYMVSEDGEVDMMHEVDGVNTSYNYEDVSPGIHYFVMTMVDTDGQESDFSEMISVSVL